MRIIAAILLILFLSFPAFAERHIKLVLPYPGEDTVLKETDIHVVDEHWILSVLVDSGLRDGEYIDPKGVAHKVKAMYMKNTNDGHPYAKLYFSEDKLEPDKDVPKRINEMWEETQEPCEMDCPKEI